MDEAQEKTVRDAIKEMEWVEVEGGSGNVQRVGYDLNRKVVGVEFAGGVYGYHDVPAELGDQFPRFAPNGEVSTGKMVNAHLKGKHEFIRV